MPDDSVFVGEKQFDVGDIFSVEDVRRAFRKALEAQEYQVGQRRVRRADLDKLWGILKAAENEDSKMCWDKYAGRSSRQVLLTD
jgi:hypothetical protein